MQVWLDLGFSFRKEKKNQETYEHVKVEGERWGLYWQKIMFGNYYLYKNCSYLLPGGEKTKY